MSDSPQGQHPTGDAGRARPVAFVVEGRPPSSNKNVGASGLRYQQHVAQLYRAAGGTWSNEHRYGVVYYFLRRYRPSRDADVGNVTKRLWDALTGVGYADDEVVRLQLAGLIETGGSDTHSVDLAQLDLTDIPLAALAALLDKIDGGSEHLLYIEIGLLQPTMYVFNLAGSQQRGTT